MRKLRRLCSALAMFAVVPVATAQRPAPGFDPESSLLEAVQRLDQAAVEALIADGVDPNARRDDGSTPLLWAALRGGAEIAAVLLRAGADPRTLHIVDIEELPLSYLAGGAVRLRVEAVGEMRSERPTPDSQA